MAQLKTLVLIPALVTGVTLSAQTYVQLDLSSYVNYDGVGTSNEIAYAATQQDGVNSYALRYIQGNHNLRFSTAYTDDASAGAGDALPNDGILASGKYLISTNFDDAASGYSVAAPNMFLISADNGTASTVSETITLLPGEQGQYSAINLAFITSNGGTASSYASQISVTYTDASTEVILLTTNASGDGLFGAGNFSLSSDSSSYTNEAPGTGETITLSNIFSSNDYLGISGSGATQKSIVRSGSSNIYEFSDDLELDSSKTLESITISLTKGGTNRQNQMYLLGTTLTAVPEPRTYAMLAGLGILAFAIVRRRR
ncbi:PEP-CTERM sorting domain-containing protein [Cerasicoccus maritimus]|uniref:PEP-CTERM sorting domain-containing protein n=1 Tax=Cerasicoccus maritimus TaxID=490089 RepID=UPI002852A7AC|nr:PEP-CTERM sorting domain-containing protein [Cerasicoccus maritimus]